MRHATSLLYHVCAVASRNIRFASCGTSGKLTLWTRYVLADPTAPLPVQSSYHGHQDREVCTSLFPRVVPGNEENRAWEGQNCYLWVCGLGIRRIVRLILQQSKMIVRSPLNLHLTSCKCTTEEKLSTENIEVRCFRKAVSCLVFIVEQLLPTYHRDLQST
jgi:hypothetical protein